MKISNLQTFLAVIQTGSLSRAANRLNVTQSTVTARLQALEDSLGQRLVNRQKSGATATAAGLRLRRYAEAMSGLWDQARQEVALPADIRVICNLGCDSDLWTAAGVYLFDVLRAHQPDIAISVWEGNAAETAGWLDSGLVDIALGYAPSAATSQTTVRLADEALILVSPDPDRPVTFDPEYVFVEAGIEFAREHAAAYANADTANISFNRAEWALSYLRSHGGSAYIPQRLAAPLVAARRLFVLPGAPVFHRPVYLLVNNATTRGWTWLDAALDDVGAQISTSLAATPAKNE
jgi:DNA-binding transcriptional LysR family regulator